MMQKNLKDQMVFFKLLITWLLEKPVKDVWQKENEYLKY